jgi:hypothetical protein
VADASYKNESKPTEPGFKTERITNFAKQPENKKRFRFQESTAQLPIMATSPSLSFRGSVPDRPSSSVGCGKELQTYLSGANRLSYWPRSHALTTTTLDYFPKVMLIVAQCDEQDRNNRYTNTSAPRTHFALYAFLKISFLLRYDVSRHRQLGIETAKKIVSHYSHRTHKSPKTCLRAIQIE